MMFFKNNKKLETSIEHKPPPFDHHDEPVPVPLPPALGLLLGAIVGVIVLKKVFK